MKHRQIEFSPGREAHTQWKQNRNVVDCHELCLPQMERQIDRGAIPYHFRYAAKWQFRIDSKFDNCRPSPWKMSNIRSVARRSTSDRYFGFATNICLPLFFFVYTQKRCTPQRSYPNRQYQSLFGFHKRYKYFRDTHYIWLAAHFSDIILFGVFWQTLWLLSFGVTDAE